MTEEKIKLPKTKIAVQQINPKRLVIYSKPKAGKTTLFSTLDSNLLVDLEDGSDYVQAFKIKANNLEELKEIGKQIKEAGYPYKYITIDTVTALEDMVLPHALKLYQKTPMGQRYNDDVLKLPNGAGYYYLREAFFSVLDYIDTLAPHIILSGHIKDKVTDDNGKLVESANIDLKGKLRSLICAQSDAIGYLYRKDKQTVITFNSTEDVTCGARPEHLKNATVVVAEEIDGKYVSYWDRIYK